MSPDRRVGAAVLALALCVSLPSAGAVSTPAPRTAGPLDAGAVVPAGHPSISEDEVPPRERSTAAGGSAADPPEDGVFEAPMAPRGSIDVHVLDPAGRPLAQTEVTLGVLYNSVAKGESRRRLTRLSDDAGVARFLGLDVGSGVAYRPMVIRDGATFEVSPFGLAAEGGMRALLHVYPVTNDVEQALIVTQSMVYAEVKDDRIQVQQSFKIYNFGRNAWVPSDVVVKLPDTFTAFATQQAMTDIGADAVANKGVRIRGTFGPGEHLLEFKWQLPYSGEAEVTFDVGMPPHLAAVRVIAPAAKGMNLEVDGFDKTRPSADGMGQRALITEKQIRRDDPPVRSLHVTIRGLPTEGPGKVIAAVIALAGVVMGLVLGGRSPPARDTRRERRQLLRALEGLEIGRREGTVGPKTYDRARRELIDHLARCFAADSVKSASLPRRKA